MNLSPNNDPEVCHLCESVCNTLLNFATSDWLQLALDFISKFSVSLENLASGVTLTESFSAPSPSVMPHMLISRVGSLLFSSLPSLSTGPSLASSGMPPPLQTPSSGGDLSPSSVPSSDIDATICLPRPRHQAATCSPVASSSVEELTTPLPTTGSSSIAAGHSSTKHSSPTTSSGRKPPYSCNHCKKC